MSRAYYNENDRHAAEWLRSLIREGLISDGEVDERGIEDVRGEDLRGFTRVHLFAGIGGWDYALGLAGWPSDRPVWTGSCPCQPFSAAGKGLGEKDPRHLWPHMRRLVAECRPPVVFGEQVASRAGRGWLSGVRADLEALGYAIGASDLCAAGAGAPQIRQRLYWMADATGVRSWPAQSGDGKAEAEGRRAHTSSSDRRFTDGFGNIYRIPESDVPFVVNGFPGILDQIRAYGNAIVPQVAAEFIMAYMESVGMEAP